MSDDSEDMPERGRGPTEPPTPEPEGGRAGEDDLRATADAIKADATRLAAIEARKGSLKPRDPLLGELSEAAVDLADRIAAETRAERGLTEELA
ncbi:MAG: hypothetical protein ACJ776_07450 [Chloroflexota bacterium]